MYALLFSTWYQLHDLFTTMWLHWTPAASLVLVSMLLKVLNFREAGEDLGDVDGTHAHSKPEGRMTSVTRSIGSLLGAMRGMYMRAQWKLRVEK